MGRNLVVNDSVSVEGGELDSADGTFRSSSTGFAGSLAESEEEERRRLNGTLVWRVLVVELAFTLLIRKREDRTLPTHIVFIFYFCRFQPNFDLWEAQIQMTVVSSVY